MGVLTIRSLDDDLLDALRRRAIAHDRSTEAEVRAIIREAVSRPERPDKPLPDRSAIIEELRRFRELMPMIDPPITTDLLREDRDR